MHTHHFIAHDFRQLILQSKICDHSKQWACRSVCGTHVETKVSQKLNLWRDWPITIRKYELSSPQSSPVSKKNWVSAVGRPHSIRRHAPTARSAVREAVTATCHGRPTPLLILAVLRSEVEDRVCLGLLKFLIIMEISPDLDSSTRTTHEEFLLRRRKMHALLVVRMERALKHQASDTRPIFLTPLLHRHSPGTPNQA